MWHSPCLHISVDIDFSVSVSGQSVSFFRNFNVFVNHIYRSIWNTCSFHNVERRTSVLFGEGLGVGNKSIRIVFLVLNVKELYEAKVLRHLGSLQVKSEICWYMGLFVFFFDAYTLWSNVFIRVCQTCLLPEMARKLKVASK